jgi:hypothetical protein
VGELNMMAVKSEVVNIDFTGEEVQSILMDHVYSKYPELKNSEQWNWEDFSLNFNSKKLEDGALSVIFIRHSGYQAETEQLNLPIFQTRTTDNV